MRKEHKKLYKSGKNWMVATMVTAGLAGGVLLGSANNVQADASPATAQTVSADTSVAQASQAVSNDQSRLSSANNTLQQQKSQLSAANDSSNKAAKAYSDAQNAQTKAVSGAQQAYDQAKQNTANAQQGVNQAQQGVQTAQNNEKQAVESAANQKAAAAQSTIDQLKSKATAAQTAQLNNQISDVNGKISTAQSEVNNTNSQISNLQKQVKDLQNEQGQKQNFDGFHYPAEAGVPGTKTDLTKYDNQYSYVSNPADEQVKVDDYANLSPEVQKELTIYAAQLVNSFAKEAWEASDSEVYAETKEHIHYQPLMINDGSLGEARYAAQLYDQDNWSISQHGDHDGNALKTAAIKYGAYVDDVDGKPDPAVDESATGQILATGSRSTTLDKLKNAVFNAINNMLYDDVENGNTHMMSLVQAWHLHNGWHFGHDWLGLAFDKLGQLHLVFAENHDTTINYDGPIYKATNYNYSPYLSASNQSVDNSAKINQLNNQISSLQKTLSSQKANLQTLQNQLADLKQQKANVQVNMNNLSSAEQLSYRQAQQTLNTVNAWKQSQLANVDNAASVKAAKQSLAQANNKLKDAQAKEATAKTALDNAKKGNSDLSTKQAAYQAAQQQVKNLNDQINKTQAVIDQLNAKLKQDQQRLLELQKIKETTTKTAKTGSSTVATAGNGNKGNGTITLTTSTNPKENNSSTNTAAANAHSVAATTSAKAGAAANNNKLTVKLPSSTTAVSANDYAAVNMTREQYKAQQTNTSSANNTLPQTGHNNSKAVIALGILAGMFGLSLAAKGGKQI